MNKKIVALTSIVCFTLSPISYVGAAPAPSEAYETKSVGKITILMENLPADASFDPKPVLGKMDTKIGDPFSQTVFDADLKTLSGEYDRVEPSLEIEGGSVNITIRVWARPMISAIKWVGNTHISSGTLQKELGIKPKKVYNRAAFNKAFNKVKEYYIKKGYFEAQLSYSLNTNPKDNTVEVVVQVNEGRAGIIDDIIFEGFTNREESKLLEQIYTKKHYFLWSWFAGTGTFNEELIDQDTLTVINFMQNRGYADAKVSIRADESTKEGKIVVVITLDRGPLFHFGKVTFTGNTRFESSDIEKLFSIHPGDVYSPDKVRETAQGIKDLYGRKGFIETNVQYETQIDPKKDAYNINFLIEESEEYKIGLIRVFGNVQTQTHVILRESLLVPGETFDSSKLKYTQDRLEQMGYFKSVNVYAVRTQDDQLLGENFRDVYIEVEETTTGNLSLFFGLSTSDGIFGGLDLTETNFNYKGFGRLFKEGPSAMRGGGEYAHAKVTLGNKERQYLISWLTPYFYDSLWRVGFDLFLSQSKLEAKKYEINSMGGSTYASYPINAYWTFGTRYRFKHAKIEVSHSAGKQEQKLEQGDGNVSAASASMTFDSTDNIMKPRNGFRSLMDFEFAGIGGRFAFLRYQYVNNYYQRLWKKGTMKYRWEFKFIQPILWTKQPGNIPISERFFVGGENTVRGYKPFHIGAHFGDGDPVGGISYSVLSVEYNQELFKFLDAFLFIDAGSTKLSTFHLAQYKWSYGIGARVELINRVPLTLGVGFPVNPSKDEVQKFFFQMGGQF
jgi:outer membrane protein insertion porin family